MVESIQDVMAIENTRQFNGLYHVLGGIISPIDGIGPADLKIDSLEEKVKTGDIKEIILALAEGRQAQAQGYTLSEFGALLTKIGAYDAVNLDGGGSATLIINGKRVSGRPFGEKTERPVVNVISIVKP